MSGETTVTSRARDIILLNRNAVQEGLQRMKGGDCSVVIKEVECFEFLREGDSALGQTLAVKCTTEEDASLDADTHLVMKSEYPPETVFGEMLRRGGFFEKEIKGYKQLFPAMNRLAERATISPLSVPDFVAGGVMQDNPASEDSRCADHDDGETSATSTSWLTMADLRHDGYKMTDIRDGLDFEHCRLVMIEFAKFHALSFAVKNEAASVFDQQYAWAKRENIFTENLNRYFGDMTKLCIDSCLYLVAESSPDSDFAIKANKLKFDTPRDILSFFRRSQFDVKEPYATICMRDTQGRNFMYKYDNSNSSKPIDVKFLDFQTLVYQMPTNDLALFLYSNTLRDFRETNISPLLKIYHEHFTQFVKQLGLMEFVDFSFETFNEHFARSKLWAIAYTINCVPMLTLNRDDTPNWQDPKFASGNGRVKEMVRLLKISHQATRFVDLLMEAVDNDLL